MSGWKHGRRTLPVSKNGKPEIYPLSKSETHLALIHDKCMQIVRTWNLWVSFPKQPGTLSFIAHVLHPPIRPRRVARPTRLGLNRASGHFHLSSCNLKGFPPEKPAPAIWPRNQGLWWTTMQAIQWGFLPLVNHHSKKSDQRDRTHWQVLKDP